MFGIFAVQLHKVNAADIASAAAIWADTPEADFAQLLEERGAISHADRTFITHLVNAAIAAQNDDPVEALESIGGPDAIYCTFRHSITLSEDGEILRAAKDRTNPESDDERDTLPILDDPPRYSDEAEYARGGMGRILIAHDSVLRRTIALKELLPPSPREGEVAAMTPMHRTANEVARFLREARVASQLEHPAIVPVYELGLRRDGRPYYTMKLVEGITLADAIRDAKSDRERLGLLRHFIDLCEAVAYAHTRLVIHRDLKPGNVMVGEFGETVLIDWGLARVLGKDDIHADELRETYEPVNVGGETGYEETQYGKLKGTLPYMSPEQVRGDIDLLDARSDVYSLGAVLYEILTGRPPFVELGAPLIRTRKMILEQSPEPPDKRNSAVPRELSAICMKAMSKNPAQRYPNAKSLAQDVLNFTSGNLVDAHQYGPRDLFRHFVRRYRKPLIASAAASLVLMSFAAYYNVRLFKYNRDLEVKTAEARELLYSVVISNAGTQLSNGRVDLVPQSFWDAPIEHSNWEWGYYARQIGPLFAKLEGHTSAVNDVSWSLTSRILTVSDDNTGRVWDENGNLKFVLRGHSGAVNFGKFSPDGERILTGSDDKTGRLWLARTADQQRVGDLRRVLEGHTGPLNYGEFSPDGSWILTVSDDGTGRVWRGYSGELQSVLKGHTESVKHGAFSPDGNEILTVSSDRTVRVWDASTGNLRLVLAGHGDHVNHGVYSPDGSAILTVSGDSTGRVWATSSGELQFALEGHSEEVNLGSYSPDGSRILTVSNDYTGRVWDAQTGELSSVLKGHSDSVRFGTFSPDGLYVLTVSDDSTARVWNPVTGEVLAVMRGHQAPVVHGAVSFLVNRFVTASADGKGIVWDFDPLHPRSHNILEGHKGPVVAGEFNRDGTEILTASVDGTGRVWDRYTGELRFVLEGHKEALRSGAFSPDGSRILTVSADATACIWDARSGTLQHRLEDFTTGVRHGIFKPDGQDALTVSDDETCHVWDVNSGKLLFMLGESQEKIAYGVYSPDGSTILTVSSHGSHRTWNANTGQAKLTFGNQRNGARFCAYSSDGNLILTTSGDENLAHVWDAHSGKELQTLEGHQKPVWHGSFNPDSNRICTVALDRTSRVWDARTGMELFRLNTDELFRSSAFSQDGSRIITIPMYGDRIEIWDGRTGDSRAQLPGHSANVNGAVFSPDESCILTWSIDSTARVWETLPWNLDDSRLSARELTWGSAEVKRKWRWYDTTREHYKKWARAN